MKSFILFIAAILLFIIFAPFGVLYTLWITFLFKKNQLTLLEDFSFSMAQSIDMIGNVILADLFNRWIINENGYQYGRAGETISSATGKNVKLGTLTKAGNKFNNTLTVVFGTNHAVNSIQIFA